MKIQPKCRSLAALALALAVPLGPLGLSTAVAPANAAAADTSQLWPASAPNWQKYLRTPSSDLRPVSVLSTSGSVTNAGALAGGGGVTTLTVAAGGAPATVVLDYGQEIGGIPYFNISSLSPATGTTLPIRSGFSESKEYLLTGGNTTVSSAVTAGDTVVHVASITNFTIGDDIKIGNDTAKVAGVGTPATNTTLAAAAAAGDTNVKVRSVGGIAVGDQLTVGAGASAETIAVTSVGTAALSTTLSAAAAAGATTIALRSSAGLAAGSVISVGSESATVASVSGTTVTLTAGLASAAASGTAVTSNGTGITVAAPLGAAHALGEVATSPGTGIAVSTPLSAHAVAEAVTSSPGALTGDYASAGTGVDVTVSAAGQVKSALEGGFRYQAIRLSQPGTIKISSAGITFGAYRATADKYEGNFVSSDEELNQLYYDGAYTVQMNMIPTGTAGSTTPQLFDGAKRDRRIWSGDLLQENSTIANTLGSNGYDYIKADLNYLVSVADGAGQLGSVGQFRTYSLSYSIDTALAMIQYYRYSGDSAFIETNHQALLNELNYLAGYLDDRGFVVTTSSNGRDWAFDDGAHAGVDTYYNILYVRLLDEMSWLESQRGENSLARTYSSQATALKDKINSTLYSDQLGGYMFLESKPDVLAQDANVASVLWDIAPKDKQAAILNTVKTKLWGTNGSKPYTDNANFRHVMSPYINGFETAARFKTGDVGNAMTLMDNMWGNMSRSAQYNGTFWEELQYDGTFWMGGHDSLAHGWSTAPTSQSTEYILGIQPVNPGYKTWSVDPHAGNLAWAEGSVPTVKGDLAVKFGQKTGRFDIQVDAPAETSGTVAVPLPSADSAVTVNGATVWSNGHFSPTAGITGATLSDRTLTLEVAGGDTYLVQAAPAAVEAATTHTTLTASATSQQYNASKPVQLTAVVSVDGGAAADGTVTFNAGSKTLATVVVKDGKASANLPANTPVGAIAVSATFTPSGASSEASSTSGVVNLHVVKATSATSFIHVKVNRVHGQRHLTQLAARVTLGNGRAAAGTVVYSVDGHTVASTKVVAGVATVKLNRELSAGRHHVRATYVPSNVNVAGSASATLIKAAKK